MVAETAQAKTF